MRGRIGRCCKLIGQPDSWWLLVAGRRCSALASRALTAHKLYSALAPGGYMPNPKHDIDRLRRIELQKIQKSRFLPNLIQRNFASSCETTSTTLFTCLSASSCCVLGTMSWRGVIGCEGLNTVYERLEKLEGAVTCYGRYDHVI